MNDIGYKLDSKYCIVTSNVNYDNKSKYNLKVLIAKISLERVVARHVQLLKIAKRRNQLVTPDQMQNGCYYIAEYFRAIAVLHDERNHLTITYAVGYIGSGGPVTCLYICRIAITCSVCFGIIGNQSFMRRLWTRQTISQGGSSSVQPTSMPHLVSSSACEKRFYEVVNCAMQSTDATSNNICNNNFM